MESWKPNNGRHHAKKVTTVPEEDPMTYLFSDSESEEEHVRRVTVEDCGSNNKCVRVEVQNVPVYGFVDTGADITILGGKVFQKVAALAKLKKKDFKPCDKTACNYDGKLLHLDGKMHLNITFGGHTMSTPIYIKMDAEEQLLLSEGVCRQLGIVSYHPQVEVWRGRQKQDVTHTKNKVKVPTIRVKLINSVSLSPDPDEQHQSSRYSLRSFQHRQPGVINQARDELQDGAE